MNTLVGNNGRCNGVGARHPYVKHAGRAQAWLDGRGFGYPLERDARPRADDWRASGQQAPGGRDGSFVVPAHPDDWCAIMQQLQGEQR